MLIIRKASVEDVQAIKCIADTNKGALGFVVKSALEESARRGWLLVADLDGRIIGFCHYRHCRDGHTTIYEICVSEPKRGQGIGRQIITTLIQEAQRLNQSHLLLKCTVDNQANCFYRHLGFALLRQEEGKKRALNVWILSTVQAAIPAFPA